MLEKVDSHFTETDNLANTSIRIAYIAGNIHIWDRKSGALLHHIQAQVVGGDLTCVAWNPVTDPFMFTTGSHDGAVHVWTPFNHSSQPSIYPEFGPQHEEGVGGVTPQTQSLLIYPPHEGGNKVGPSGSEGGMEAHEPRASLSELGVQPRVAGGQQ